MFWTLAINPRPSFLKSTVCSFPNLYGMGQINFKVPCPISTNLSISKSSSITAIYVLSGITSKISSAGFSVISQSAISSFNVSKFIPFGTIIPTGTGRGRVSVSVLNNLAPGYPGVFRKFLLKGAHVGGFHPLSI
ncbi:hypothetical protein bthur0004_64190 [Bacillus thuringiensis serovar sotto str. T04001]|nr:hypothetical protein bthur0004_64190 [Bacillus thuringiensis serovar sotto str. T04001]